MDFEFLTDENILKIHNKSKELLAEFGLKVKHEFFLNLLAEKGFFVDFKEKIIKIPYEVQDKFLKMVPSFHTVSGWDIKNKLEIKTESDAFYPRNATGSIFISDYKTGERITGKTSDLINASIILENLDSLKIICGSIYPNDVNPKYRDLFVLKTLLQYSSKYMYLQPYNKSNLKVMLDMIDVIKEEYNQVSIYPLMNASISATSPLKFDAMDIDLLYELCNNMIPVLMCVGPISGLTAPVTLAGGLVVQHSESMAGFIFSQVIKEGTPILYEPRLTGADMRTANISHASIEFVLTTLASIKLAKLLNIPVDVGSMICDSKLPDSQAGIEKSIGLFMTGQYKPSVISGIGNLEAANSYSLEQAVIDSELIKMFKRLKNGFDVNDNTLALDLIKEIGYESNYITSTHTLENYKNEQAIFDIFDRDFGQSWENKGLKGIVDNAHDKVNKILKNNKDPILDSRIIRKIDNIYDKYIEKL